MKIENRRLFVPWLRSPALFECSHGYSCESRNKTERDICCNLERPWNRPGGGRNRWGAHLDSQGSMESLYLIAIGFPSMKQEQNWYRFHGTLRLSAPYPMGLNLIYVYACAFCYKRCSCHCGQEISELSLSAS